VDGQKFRRQARIAHFVVDFYCPAQRLVIEIDGEVHGQQTIRDRDRQEVLEDLGMRVVRFAAKDCEDKLSSVLEKIRIELHAHPAPPSLSLGEGEGGRKAG
jgi:very-short-patch-repair endonuclease